MTRLHPTEPDVMRCPFAYYAQLHAEDAPAREEPGIGWIAADHEWLTRMSKDTTRFSSAFYGAEGPSMTGVGTEPYSPEVQALVDRLEPMANALLLADPPVHSRQKAIVGRALNAARVRAMVPDMRRVAGELIDGFAADGRCELLDQFAIWYPMRLICLLLGCDPGHERRFKVWTDHIAHAYLDVLDNARRAEVLGSVLEFQGYMLERIAERRATPTDDLLSDLVNTEVEGRTLTDAELLTVLSQILPGGNHATTDLLGNAVVRLVRHPEAMAAVRADPALIAEVVEESLRLEAPTRCTYRITTQDAEVGGATIPAGSVVAMAWGAAGHDPAVFPVPDAFDIRRPNVRRHLSFGQGNHFCPGAELARAQARVALETLLERLQDIRFAPDHDEPVPKAMFPYSGYPAIHLQFRAA